MELSGQIILNNRDWTALCNNLLSPSAEYTQSLNDYMRQLDQSLEIEESGQVTIIRSDRINFDRLFSILDRESVEKHTIKDRLSTIIADEWISNNTASPYSGITSMVKSTDYIDGSNNSILAAA